MQFGSIFKRFLWKIFQSNLKWGPVFLMKGDIANGLYQGWLQEQAFAQLWLVMPSDIRYGEHLIDFSLADPLRWVESPPFFTALFKTTVDLGNASIWAGTHTLFEKESTRVPISIT